MNSDLLRITGIGVVSALGVGREQVTAALLDGVCAYPGEDGAAHAPDDLENCFSSPKTYLDRSSALCLAASFLALQDAPAMNADPEQAPVFAPGLACGTAYGCPDTMLRFWQTVVEKGPRLANPLFFSHSYPNTPASLEAIEHSLPGVHLTFCQGSASGALAIGAAADALRLGRSTRMLAGGFDPLLPDAALPNASKRPGAVRAEGAAMLVLDRSAPGPDDIGLGGWGMASFCSNCCDSADGAGASRAIRTAMTHALAASGLERGSVGLVLLAGIHDERIAAAEAEAVAQLFNSSSLPACTSATGRFGAVPGASVLFAALMAGVALNEEWVAEAGSIVDGYSNLPIVQTPLERSVSAVLVNSIDPGGCCVSFVIARGDAGDDREKLDG